MTRVDALLDCIDVVVDAEGRTRVVYCHYCWVDEDDAKHIVEGFPIGSRCCRRPAVEGPEKVAAAACNFVFGSRWEVATESRWSYISKVWKNQALLMLLEGSLSEMLEGVKFHCNVEMSLEADLARLIAQESDNWQAKNKMRIIRICKNLLPAGASLQMVVGIVVSAPLEHVHFSVLGKGGEKADGAARLTLQELVNPTTSPVCEAQSVIVGLMDNFHADANKWVLLSFLGKLNIPKFNKLHSMFKPSTTCNS